MDSHPAVTVVQELGQYHTGVNGSRRARVQQPVTRQLHGLRTAAQIVRRAPGRRIAPGAVP
jgi:hypothetical protein